MQQNRDGQKSTANCVESSYLNNNKKRNNIAGSSSVHSGSFYFFYGMQLITLPGIRRFVLVPLLVNMLLFGGAFYWLFHQLKHWMARLMWYVPGFLQWLDYLLWPLAVMLSLIIFGCFFSTIANWIAAPFNGLLAEQLEARLTGQTPPDEGLLSAFKDVPRVMRRETRKLLWYLPRALGLLVISFIPVIGHMLAPVLWFMFGGWMLAIQYCDYPFDNHKVPFEQMRAALWQRRWCNLQFGLLVNLFTLIPLLNLVIMPVAVCGATAMWVDGYRQQHQRRKERL